MFDDCSGWGWAILPFLCNMLYVGFKIGLFEFEEIVMKWNPNNVFLEYFVSFFVLALINGFAIWFHNGYVLFLILIFPFLLGVSMAISE